MRHWQEERRIEPRRRFLLDHGSKGVILAERRDGDETVRSLVWFEGHRTPACGIRGFGHIYSEARLDLIDGRGHHIATVFAGGRLSRGRIDRAAAVIDSHLGDGASALVMTNRTLVIVHDSCDSRIQDESQEANGVR